MMVTLIMKNLPLLQQPIQVLISLNSFKSYIKFQQMRNRQVIQFLICPRYFLSLTIPYKGKYFVRTRLYQKKLLNNKITYAYPTMRQFKDIKCIKHFQQASSQVTEQDVFYDTQTFFLYYSNEKIPLNSYCTFKLEYDEMREFKTYLQFQLIRKFDSTIVEQGCMVGDKGKCQDQIVCKEVYHINSYKRVDIFQRVYFYHHEFYCALDMYIATVNMGYAQRLYKFQLVQYSLQLKTSNKQKPQATKSKSYPSLTNEIYSINNQVTQYTELRKSMLKYQQSAKVKKSFLFQSISTTIQEKYQDLSYLKYTSKQFEYMPIQETFEQLKEDKRIINDNIRYLFQRLPFLIRDISLATFKVLITQSLKRKSDLKKKYLIKKVLYNNPEQSIQNMTPRMSFGQKTEFVSAELLRNTYTFKQTRKSEKQEFIHVRRQQFVKAFQIINFKDCSFPMMLIEKGSQNFLEKNGCLKGFENIIKGKTQAKDVDQLIEEDFSLIVLVHGFQGSHHDLRKLKNFLQFLNPHFKILPINSIEKDTSQNIQFLGQKIAAQIQFYIANSYEKIKQISFIGFSLGGVLIRASLKYLSKHKDLMRLLITLASPHLGVSESENALVNFGIWYLSKVEKAKNIKELNFQSVTQKDSFLMKLSQGEEIVWFKKVVIVSSSEDQFVPHYSARIIGNTKNSQINQMAKNIMSKIKNYERMQVWFDVEKKSSLDKLIGRKSHIEFIENFAFLQMLCQIYQKEF